MNYPLPTVKAPLTAKLPSKPNKDAKSSKDTNLPIHLDEPADKTFVQTETKK